MYTIENKTLTDIADAIREKTGKSGLIKPEDMAGEIEGIKPNLQSKTATANGTVTADSGYDGLSSVVVDVSGLGGKYDILEYIESNGTQAIDTGIAPSANDVFYAIVTFSDDLYSWPVGGGTDTKWFGYQLNKDISIYVGSSSSPTYHDAKSWTSHPKGYIFNIPSDAQSDISICIFCYHQNDQMYNLSKNKFYSMRIGDNYFVPARRIEDEQIGVLNTYTGEFLTDVLNGDPFVTGPVIYTK